MRLLRAISPFFLLLPVAVAESFICPDVDGQTVTDDSGVQYTIGCYDDTQPASSYSNVRVTDGFNDCFAQCDGDSKCAAFTFHGDTSDVNGAGDGLCYMKSTSGAATAFFQSTGTDIVGAVKTQYLELGGARPYLDAKYAKPSQFVCPGDSGKVVTDTFGVQYVISCGQDTTQNDTAVATAEDSFNECFYYCSWTYSDCLAFTYIGAANGVGEGKCYIKTSATTYEFSGGGSTAYVGAVLLADYDGATITDPATTITSMVSLERRLGGADLATTTALEARYAYAQAVQTVYYTSVQYVTQTVVTSYPVTNTVVTTQVQTYTSSITVTATTVTTLPDVTTTLQLTTVIPTTVTTTVVYTSIVSQTTTLQLTTVVPTTVVTTRYSTLTLTTTISNTVTTTINPVVTVTPTVLYQQTVTVTPSFG